MNEREFTSKMSQGVYPKEREARELLSKEGWERCYSNFEEYKLRLILIYYDKYIANKKVISNYFETKQQKA